MSNTTTTKAPKAPNQKKKNITTVPKATAKGRMVYRVPECAEHYFDALCNPFAIQPGVCIPCDLFPIPSQKVKTFIRGTLNVGVSGIGYFAANPVIVNDGVCTAFTTALSAGNAATAFNGFTNTGGTFMTQLPYTAAQLAGTTLRGRVVACGIRIKYIGKLMDSNGLVCSIEDPDHSDVLSQSWNGITSNKYTTVDRIYAGNHWDKSVCYSGPVTTTDLEFRNTAYPLGGTTFFLCAISGAAGDLYEYEYYQHTEYIGSIVVGKTMSHVEQLSYGKAMEVIKSATIDRPLEPFMAPTLWQRFKSGISESLPKFLNGGAAVVQSVMSMDPSKLYEGYKGIESGFIGLLGDYGRQGMQNYKALPAPSNNRIMENHPLMLPAPRFREQYIEVVEPTRVEVVDHVITHPLLLKSLGFEKPVIPVDKLPSKEERSTNGNFSSRFGP